MKAWVLHGINDIRLEEVEKPDLKKNEVLVRVMAVGICGSDIPRIYQTGAHRHPLIPGHEFSGVIEAGGDSGWTGKRVGVFPLIPCETCVSCKRKQYEMCRNYSYLGSRQDGGFAEYVAVPEKNLIELPENVSYEQAAMFEPMAVATHAMRGIPLETEQSVAVCGLGTIGMLLVMFLKEAGIRNLYVIGNKDFQLQKIIEMGIPRTAFCDCRKVDPVDFLMEQTDGIGIDVFFECVGKNETVSQGIQAAAPGGWVQLVGNPASDMHLDRDIYWKVLRNQLTVRGSWNSSFIHDTDDDWHYVLDRLAAGSIHPERYITQRLPLGDLEKGLHIMRDKTEEYLKVMITREGSCQ